MFTAVCPEDNSIDKSKDYTILSLKYLINLALVASLGGV